MQKRQFTASADQVRRGTHGSDEKADSGKTDSIHLFRNWMIGLVVFMALTALAIAGFNALVDPFGVFGDKAFNWYAYDMTNNPRTAKIAYLDERNGDYDSYIIGCSKTSSFSVELLDKYYEDAKFYNMIMYGGDMYDIKMTARYVLDSYKPKNIVIALGLEETVNYNVTEDRTKNNLHAKVEGAPLLPFYAKYLFLNPSYAADKLGALADRSLLPKAFDVFEPETGVYNKSRRDAERIVDMDEFMANNPGFEYDLTDKRMRSMDKAVADVAEIRRECESRGVSFMLIMVPLYYKEVDNYSYDELAEYWRALADVTEFWDFSGYSPISFDERYFYDAYHFRNSVGDMALARIFGDESVFVPENFGRLTTRENAEAHAAEIFAARAAPEIDSYTAKLPILMYHDIDPKPAGDTCVTPERFKNDMDELAREGYTAVSFGEVRDFVLRGGSLPEKPVVISFDDGYRSNYTFAFDILKAAGMKATINLIGVSVGKSVYKDSDKPIIPHFGYEEARMMYESGVVDIQSHSWAMHDSAELEDPKVYREGVMARKGEGEKAFAFAFRADALKSREEIEKNVGNEVFVYAYPFGFYNELAEAELRDMGYTVTLSIDEGVNTLLRGLPQSLIEMRRISVYTNSPGVTELIERA
ncbi:MAG: polysaccharide deacetylase family protein [Clostridiales Family XIII bacterium]|jgi:peptidoglycan/xylan/chitin deacetylase (PgdA/CDA1 family)|nr:polysaccharide deacetylase family protein [Clostridiales Family XIII bacterium]